MPYDSTYGATTNSNLGLEIILTIMGILFVIPNI